MVSFPTMGITSTSDWAMSNRSNGSRWMGEGLNEGRMSQLDLQDLELVDQQFPWQKRRRRFAET